MPPKVVEHPTWAEIDAEALCRNVLWIRSCLSPRTRLLAVVKADAYGHGAPGVAQVLSRVGVDYFGVAHVGEGEILRGAGVRKPILILSETIPELLPSVVRGNFAQTVYTEQFIDLLNTEAKRQGKQVAVHFKVDTGMGRVGARGEEITRILEAISGASHLFLEGIYTHFANASEKDGGVTREQFTHFQEIIDTQKIPPNVIRHAANSAALLHFPETQLDMVRVGLLLYGIVPNGSSASHELSPVLSLKTEVRYVKEVPAGSALSYGGIFVTNRPSKIATIPIGYADGLPVRVSNRASVLIRGNRFPIVGRVTMDMTLVDVTNDGVCVGDEVVVIGSQNGERITAEELAGWAETIPYETVCGIGKRIPRMVVNENVFISKVATAKL